MKTITICIVFLFFAFFAAPSLYCQSSWFEERSIWGYDLNDGIFYGFERMTADEVQAIGENEYLVRLFVEATTTTSDFPQWTRYDTLILRNQEVLLPYEDTLLSLYNFDLEVGDSYTLL